MGSKWVWVKLFMLFILLENIWWSEACWEQERFALLQIKHSLPVFADYPTTWVEGDENSDCCHWERVECSNSSGKVIKLNLSFITWVSREWYLNASLFTHFRELEWLDLSDNNIVRCLEKEGFERLSQLNNLKILNLGGNYFNNSILSSLVNLSSLRELDLTSNNLKGTINVKVLESLINLEELNMNFNAIDKFTAPEDFRGLRKLHVLRQRSLGKMSNILFQSLGSFPSLKVLDLTGNRFYEKMTTQELPNLTNLDVLILDGSSLHMSLLSAFVAFTSIEILSLNYCQLDGISNFQGFPNFKNLEVLFMDGVGLPSGFLQNSKSMTSLNVLSMSNCRLSGEIIDQGFCEMVNLQALHIKHNQLGGVLPWCFANLTSLKLLDMSFNQISGDISLSPLRYLTSIQDLKLSNNHFQIPFSLEPFYNHSNLKSFHGDINHIYEKSESYSSIPKFQLNSIRLSGYGDCGKFPKFLYHQHELQEVDLSHINLTGEFPNWLLENNTRLETLALINNSISGPFRMPVHSHKLLRAINVSNNFIQGHIPIEIGAYFPNLIYFNISQNSMIGSIPSSFGDMKLLKGLDLSHNQLSGGIPEHLTTGCFSLELLVLSNNSLQGHIFSGNFNLTNLYWLQLDDNYFTGEIPQTLFNSQSLAGLYLSGNHLSGNIPKWLGNMPGLIDVIMPNNDLEGPIPMEFCQLENLEVLDLSNNSICGSIPSCFNPPGIQQVHLSRNKIEGQLKEVFCVSSSLVTLDLSYNRLNGSILNKDDCFSRLSFLILAHNNFGGEVPIQLCQLKQLRLIDLSHNNLSGQIPSCFHNTALNENYDDTAEPDSMVALPPIMIVSFPPNGQPMRKEETIPFTTKRMTYYYLGRILSNMSGIDLSCNQLTGEIPLQIGYLNRIHALNLSHNNLTGTIPSTFSNLKQVESLDLSHNHLNGKIPPQLIELNALAIFSVAHNNLSGKIPDWTAQFGTFDQSSYEGNSLLCGPPLPKSCKEIKSPSLVPQASINIAEDGKLIDMDSFHVTFLVSYIIVLFGTTAILYVNPYWRRRWFYLVEIWMTSCYYFTLDHLPTRLCLGN